ncbi:MAG: FecCD family ABC transporter permease [Eggerthellaceae bacterium]|jgi:iron complex transport system permease protein
MSGAQEQRRIGAGALVALLTAMLVIACVASLLIGASSAGLGDLIALAGDKEVAENTQAILLNVRLPRILAAILAGAALAASGAVIQSVLDNPLASPNVLGINAGAGFAVLLCAAFLPAASAFLPLAAFLGALLTCLIVFAISQRAGTSKIAVVLAGMALTAIFTAGMNTVLIVDSDAYVGSSRFLTGGLSGVQTDELLWPAIAIAVALILCMLLSRSLNVLSLGDAIAHSLGMHVSRVRMGALAVAALLAGAAVSFAGLVGFVGLVVPHIVRFFVGHDARKVIATSIPAGALFVVVCDLAARSLFAPYEIPVGILMAFLGGPFFIYLILARKYDHV